MTYPIPDKALAQHIAVLGKTGSGKSYAVKGVVERLLDEQARACVIDPTGTWWGLKSSATGKSGGYPVVIFGGTHADLPLGAAHGEALAEAIGTSSTPAILDTSQMKVGERTRFFAEFADALVRKNKGPLHLVIDEAHLFAPQGKVNDPQSGAMLHAANNLVSLGRSRGLRIILITQRPAKLHKDSLTQVETLVAMRLIAPQDRKAVEEWIKDNADQDKGREIISSLATLKTGQAWVWAPELGVLERVAFPRIRTFDSSRAPDESDEASGLVLAPIDREAIAARLKAVAVEADANDPKKLRAQIVELQRELARKPAASVDPMALEQAERHGFERGVAGAREAQQALIEQLQRGIGAKINDLDIIVARIFEACQPIEPKGFTPVKNPVYTGVQSRPERGASRAGDLPRSRTPARLPSRGNGAGEKLSKAERLVLTALAQYPNGRTKVQVAVLARYAHNGGGFNNALSALRGRAYIADHGDKLLITPAGETGLGSFDPLPQGQELLRHWLGQLSKAEREILEVLAKEFPRELSKEEVAAATPTGYEPNGGGFNNALSRLRTLELISGRGALRASEDLF